MQTTSRASSATGWAVIAVLFAATTCVESLSWTQLSAYTPLYLRELHVPQAQVPGWIAAMSSLGWILALPLAPFWGVFADRYSRKLVIVRSAAIEALIFAGWALATNPWEVLAFRSLNGFVLGNTGVMLAVQASTTPRQRLALAVGIVGAGSPAGRAVGRIRVTPVRDPFSAETAAPGIRRPQPIQVDAQPSSQDEPPATNAVRIPESLKMPVQTATMRSVAARITPSLLAALEPVALSEDLSRGLLLQKVLPSYPEQAIRARLQGPVVLQAWIGRDGTIQDLKLIQGSFVLGQAAYRAVKQWRYQPYLVNGRAVEAQTFVTVDFKLP